MYGLKQAVRLVNDKLVKLLTLFGYSPGPYSPNIWFHNSRCIIFCLSMDYFGVQYYKREYVEHLVKVLQTAFKVYIDYNGKDCCDLKLEWNHKEGYVDVDMNGFVTITRFKIQHSQPKKTQHDPRRWNAPVYGKKQQIIIDLYTSTFLNPKE